MGNPVLFDAYEMRMFYTFDGLTHVMREYMNPQDFSEAPGQPSTAYSVLNRIGGSKSFASVVDDFIPLIQSFFGSGTVFGSAELWRYPANSQNATFLSTHQIGLPGTSPSPSKEAGQLIWTSRTSKGRLAKLYFMEPTAAAGTPNPWTPDPAGTPSEVLADFWIGQFNYFCDREQGFPIATLQAFPGQNEAIFKRRFRP